MAKVKRLTQHLPAERSPKCPRFGVASSSSAFINNERDSVCSASCTDSLDSASSIPVLCDFNMQDSDLLYVEMSRPEDFVDAFVGWLTKYLKHALTHYSVCSVCLCTEASPLFAFSKLNFTIQVTFRSKLGCRSVKWSVTLSGLLFVFRCSACLQGGEPS